MINSIRPGLLLYFTAISGELGLTAYAQSVRFSSEVAAEGRLFLDDPQFPTQLENFQGNLIFTGDVRWTSKDRNTRFVFEPFLRLDMQDGERTYADIREASLTRRFEDWDILFGVAQVFWGVAESRNIVDIVNQFDTIEDFDQGEKLGQPAFRIGKRTNIGRFEAYYLPFFREQILPGDNGRLRFDPIVDTGNTKFERRGDEWAGDFALRYENTFGKFDVGVHGFFGTSRTPLLLLDEPFESFTPFYQRLTQGGADIQYTSGPWLLKFEGAAVNVGDDTFFSSVFGFEYTLFGVLGSSINVGVIGEYLFDNREGSNVPINVFENDAFAGTRITFNDPQDTEILAGAIVDTETGGLIGSVEFQRRVGSSMLIEVEGRFFKGSDDRFVDSFDRDSHITFRLTRFF